MFTLFLTAPTYGEYTLLYDSSMGLMRKKKNSSDPYELWYLPKTASGSTISLSSGSIAIVGEYIYFLSSNVFTIYRGEEYVSTYTISAPGTSATAPLDIQVKDDIIVYCFYRSTGLIAVSFAQGALLKDTILVSTVSNMWSTGSRVNNKIVMQDEGVIYIASFYFKTSPYEVYAYVHYTRDGVSWNTLNTVSSASGAIYSTLSGNQMAYARYIGDKFIAFFLIVTSSGSSSSSGYSYRCARWLLSLHMDGTVDEICPLKEDITWRNKYVINAGALSNDREFILLSTETKGTNENGRLHRIGYDGTIAIDESLVSCGTTLTRASMFSLGESLCVSCDETGMMVDAMDSRAPIYKYERNAFPVETVIYTGSSYRRCIPGIYTESYDGEYSNRLPLYDVRSDVNMRIVEDDEYWYLTGGMNAYASTTVRHARIPKNQRRMFFGRNQYMKISD